MEDYDERFKEPREQWLHGYFNWTEEKDITDAERHTARDGFDAGANWVTKKQKTAITPENKALIQQYANNFSSGKGIDWSNVETVFNILVGAGIIKPYGGAV